MASDGIAVSRSADGRVGYIKLDRPRYGNAVSMAMWKALPEAVRELESSPGCGAIVLHGSGRHFCTGIDLGVLSTIAKLDQNEAESAATLRDLILVMQNSVSSLEACAIPVVAAIHGACYGAGVDVITACDIRYATSDAIVCVKEVDVGVTADLGTLQRLPAIVGEGLARDLAMTARPISGADAERMHLVSSSAFASPEAVLAAAESTARELADKDAFALRGTKHVMNAARASANAGGLAYVAAWNAGHLKGRRLVALMAKEKAKKKAKVVRAKL